MTSLPYWLGTIGYCVAMVFIGVWIRRRIRHDQGEQMNFEFWIAKRQLPGWRLAISLTAGWLMLGWVGFGMSQIYMYGATGLWILPIPWLILCVLVIFMVPFVRRIAAVSLPQGIGKPIRVQRADHPGGAVAAGVPVPGRRRSGSWAAT